MRARGLSGSPAAPMARRRRSTFPPSPPPSGAELHDAGVTRAPTGARGSPRRSPCSTRWIATACTAPRAPCSSATRRSWRCSTPSSRDVFDGWADPMDGRTRRPRRAHGAGRREEPARAPHERRDRPGAPGHTPRRSPQAVPAADAGDEDAEEDQEATLGNGQRARSAWRPRLRRPRRRRARGGAPAHARAAPRAAPAPPAARRAPPPPRPAGLARDAARAHRTGGDPVPHRAPPPARGGRGGSSCCATSPGRWSPTRAPILQFLHERGRRRGGRGVHVRHPADAADARAARARPRRGAAARRRRGARLVGRHADRRGAARVQRRATAAAAWRAARSS